ncbi:ArgR family transcriptional regulator [Tetragenococcus halophilus]|uniref:Arginine repressor n=1 Tax=Tetragenococcus halophilus (strain DSM 20338 / JCM 20259 / NCIMB 9735 / NBRC 12172) TaxID=945021 RepID=A0AAN1SKH3_TETHN|nr:ArgR family transcriptional regulator [Tetragenococcus halophilus]AOF49881.1 ArgR family transcriptional regulator [Tetragenococcus halophilus]MCF1685977.1 ArgR family transcriptional regulator [Tetragenococcus halophilus]MCO8284761.1 ArgR family transcriptional regulator [Tetragenococcus halophilus]MCO8289375.1 ArgR family transcriptional regulator [Tetragenococcus halophilus]MCO8294157.1 ArgR family transcriptional regulator [Tetragenococcus halophilus]
MNRTQRQAIIKKIVTENEVSTQNELLSLLEKEKALTTQATISRDIRELNITKVEDNSGKSYYRILNNSVLGTKKKSEEERLSDIIMETGVSLTQIEFTNLLTVLPGNGNAIGVLIDKVRVEVNSKIVGCIAGDDTILILSKNEEDARMVNEYFQQYLFHVS